MPEKLAQAADFAAKVAEFGLPKQTLGAAAPASQVPAEPPEALLAQKARAASE